MLLSQPRGKVKFPYSQKHPSLIKQTLRCTVWCLLSQYHSVSKRMTGCTTTKFSSYSMTIWDLARTYKAPKSVLTQRVGMNAFCKCHLPLVLRIYWSVLWLLVQHEPREVYAPVWAWTWWMDSIADSLTVSSRGISAFKRESSPCPLSFLLTYHSCRLGKAVEGLSVGFCCSQSFFCMLQGHCCVQERLFLFCIFSLKYMTFSSGWKSVKWPFQTA